VEQRTELDDDLSEIVWVTGPRKKSDIADCTIATMSSSETIFLYVGHAFHDEADGPKNDTSNITACSEPWLNPLGDLRGVQNSNW
jgi:hypothetical protein